MTFANDVMRFARKVQVQHREVFTGVVTEVKQSIVNGSPITGAPGQPVDTGNLRGSWQVVFESPTSALVGTNVVYAQQIEDGTRNGRSLVLRSKRGGFHSVKITLNGLHRIVDAVTARVTRRG